MSSTEEAAGSPPQAGLAPGEIGVVDLTEPATGALSRAPAEMPQASEPPASTLFEPPPPQEQPAPVLPEPGSVQFAAADVPAPAEIAPEPELAADSETPDSETPDTETPDTDTTVAPPAAPDDPAPARRRRWPRRLLIGTDIFVAIAVIAATGMFGYIRWKESKIKSLRLPSLSPIPAASPGAPGPPETLLIVGSDSRAANGGGDANAFGSAAAVGGQRSDTVMLLRVDPGSNRASLMSIPRDLYVHIPGTQIRDRINSTFSTGPDLLIRAIHDDLGIQINHYVEFDFQSFRGVVDAVSGVKVYFPTPARDQYSGLNITTPGCYTLDGAAALGYVRARHYSYYQNGYWHFEAESDLARVRRQQDFVRKVIKKGVNSNLTDPARLNSVVSAVVDNLTVDSALKNNQGDLLRVIKAFKRMGSDALVTSTVPTYGIVIGGADVLLLKQPDADVAVQTFISGPPPFVLPPGFRLPAAPGSTNPGSSIPAVTPAEVHVRVLNGSGVTGQATAASTALSKTGFVVLGAASADNFKYATSVIRYALGQEQKAQLLQAYVLGGATLEPDSSLHGTDVALVTGSTYGGINPISPAVAPTPSSPAPGSPGSPGILAPAPSTTTTVPVMPGTPPNGVTPPCN